MATFTSGLFREAVKNFHPGMPLSAYRHDDYNFHDRSYLIAAERDNIKGSFLEFHSKNWSTSSFQTKLNMLNSYIYNELCNYSYPIPIYDIIDETCSEADIDMPLEFQYLSYNQTHISLCVPTGLIAKIEVPIRERMQACDALVSQSKLTNNKLKNLPDIIYMNRHLNLRTIHDVNYHKNNLRT